MIKTLSIIFCFSYGAHAFFLLITMNFLTENYFLIAFLDIFLPLFWDMPVILTTTLLNYRIMKETVKQR